jgi:hypothetical protein
MNNTKKNNKKGPQKPKRLYRRPLTPEGMELIIRQKEVTYFDKWKNWTRVHLDNDDIKLIDDTLERITPWLDKKIFMKTHNGFRMNLAMFVSEDINGQGLLVTMKCGGLVKVTKALKMEFRKRI